MLNNPTSRSQSRLQQQPERLNNRQQQQSSGSHEFQPREVQQGEAQPTYRPEGSNGESRDFHHSVETFSKKSDRLADSNALSSRPTCLSETIALVKAERDAYTRRTLIG